MKKKYIYYPGCSLRSTGIAYDESIRAVFEKLNIALEELEDWNCCGATSYFSVDEGDAFALASRNLALAEQQMGNEDFDIVAPCSACYLVLLKTKKILEENKDLYAQINLKLQKVNLNYEGKVKVRHPIDVLVNDFGLDNLAKQVKFPLKGFKVASYYGCQIVRPYSMFDDMYNPTTLDRIVKALGADPVDWPLKTRCCGGSLTGTIQEAGLRMNRFLLQKAQEEGANVIITCCPLCQHNLECYQERINKQFREEINIPVIYFTQLIGIALGLSSKELGLNRLFKKPSLKRFAVQKGEVANAW